MKNKFKNLIITAVIVGMAISMSSTSIAYADTSETLSTENDSSDSDVALPGTNKNPQLNADGTIKDVYKVVVTWGDMKFKFNRQNMLWDSENHQYVSIGTEDSDSPWDLTSLKNGGNKISITNHSNCKIKAKFEYSLPTVGSGNEFNMSDRDIKISQKVKGLFFGGPLDPKLNDLGAADSNAADETKAKNDAIAAAKDFQNTKNSTYSNLEIIVDNADGSANERLSGDAKDDLAKTRSVYFAFNGIPDSYWIRKYTNNGNIPMGQITITLKGNPDGHKVAPAT